LPSRPEWGAAIGGELTLSGARRRVGPENELLAATSAAGLTAIDIVYLTKGRISPVYLLDAAEFALTGGGWRRACPKAELFPEHRRARFLRSRSADGRLYLFLFFRRRQYRRHSERGDPQLATPAVAVIKVFVFLFFDIFACLL
jgi:hypothetical protein